VKKNNKKFKKELISKSLHLAKKLMRLVDKFPKKRSAWVIEDQLLGAGTSIGANIIESQAGVSKKDFVNFLSYALKSGNETKFWLTLSKELNNKLIPEIDECMCLTEELVKILGSSVATIKGRRK